MLVRSAVEQYVVSSPPRKESGLLYVSDLGAHPYKAMARILHGETAEFDTDTRIKMNYGNAFEAETLRAMQRTYPNVQTQFPLYNRVWSGYADFVMGHTWERPVIIEHKATGDKWFDYKQSLPRAAHLCQLWMYGQLYQETYGVEPDLVLYYVAWGSYAEFRVYEDKERGVMVADGRINGTTLTRQRLISPANLRRELEHYFKMGTLPDSAGADNWDYAEEAHQRLATTVWTTEGSD
jgi:hypothetical protein